MPKVVAKDLKVRPLPSMKVVKECNELLEKLCKQFDANRPTVIQNALVVLDSIVNDESPQGSDLYRRLV